MPLNTRKILWIFVLFPIIGVQLGLATWASLKGDRELSKVLIVFAVIMGMAFPALLIATKIDERFDRLEKLLKKNAEKSECKEPERESIEKPTVQNPK